jgi:hypothetical protein
MAVGLILCPPACQSAEPMAEEGISSRDARMQAIRSVPFPRLNPQIGNEVNEVLENPSFYRRMPTQQIDCDPQMFTFLVRRPEVMVNIWDLMGITKVKAQRTSPYSFLADDGVGTACKCELVYSDGKMHIYLGNGSYDGTMSPRKVTGRCVCILHTDHGTAQDGSPSIAGTMDVFLKLDNLGADLLTRTIGPFVGKTADYNFVETAKFITQISQVCKMNPVAAQSLVSKLDKIDESTRREFASIVTRMSMAGGDGAWTSERNAWTSAADERRGPTDVVVTLADETPNLRHSQERTPGVALQLSDNGPTTVGDRMVPIGVEARGAPPTAIVPPAMSSLSTTLKSYNTTS